jgi:cell division septation protein DedD
MVFGRENEIKVPQANAPTVGKDKIADRILEKEENKWTKPLTEKEKNSSIGLIYKITAVALGILVIVGFLITNPSVLGSGTSSGNGGSGDNNNIEKLQNITTPTPTPVATTATVATSNKQTPAPTTKVKQTPEPEPVTANKQTPATAPATNSAPTGKDTTYEQAFGASKKVNEWIPIGESRDFEVFGTNVRIYTYPKPGSTINIQMLPPALPKGQKLLINMIYKNTATGEIVDLYRDRTDHSQNAWSVVMKTNDPNQVLWQVEFGLLTEAATTTTQIPKKTIVQ